MHGITSFLQWNLIHRMLLSQAIVCIPRTKMSGIALANNLGRKCSMKLELFLFLDSKSLNREVIPCLAAFVNHCRKAFPTCSIRLFSLLFLHNFIFLLLLHIFFFLHNFICFTNAILLVSSPPPRFKHHHNLHHHHSSIAFTTSAHHNLDHHNGIVVEEVVPAVVEVVRTLELSRTKIKLWRRRKRRREINSKREIKWRSKRLMPSMLMHPPQNEQDSTATNLSVCTVLARGT